MTNYYSLVFKLPNNDTFELKVETSRLISKNKFFKAVLSTEYQESINQRYEFEIVFFETPILDDSEEANNIKSILFDDYKEGSLFDHLPLFRKRELIVFADYLGCKQEIINYHLSRCSLPIKFKCLELWELTTQYEDFANFFNFEADKYLLMGKDALSDLQSVNFEIYCYYLHWSGEKYRLYNTTTIPTFIDMSKKKDLVYKNPNNTLQEGDPAFVCFEEFSERLKVCFGVFSSCLHKIITSNKGVVAGGCIVNAICGIDLKTDIDIFVKPIDHSYVKKTIKHCIMQYNLEYKTETTNTITKYFINIKSCAKDKSLLVPHEINIVNTRTASPIETFDYEYCKVQLVVDLRSGNYNVEMSSNTLQELRSRTILFPNAMMHNKKTNIQLPRVSRINKAINKGFSFLKWNKLYSHLFEKDSFFEGMDILYTLKELNKIEFVGAAKDLNGNLTAMKLIQEFYKDESFKFTVLDHEKYVIPSIIDVYGECNYIEDGEYFKFTPEPDDRYKCLFSKLGNTLNFRTERNSIHLENQTFSVLSDIKDHMILDKKRIRAIMFVNLAHGVPSTILFCFKIAEDLKSLKRSNPASEEFIKKIKF